MDRDVCFLDTMRIFTEGLLPLSSSLAPPFSEHVYVDCQLWARHCSRPWGPTVDNCRAPVLSELTVCVGRENTEM